MTAVPQLAPSRMTVDEFLVWPGDGSARYFQLVDGEPVAMAPASINHGLIQAALARLLETQLIGTRCRVVIAPGVVPRVRSDSNFRIPDLAVTCSDNPGVSAIEDPVLVIEILSPSNEIETRANVWAYATLPSVREILLVRSTRIEAELLRRDADGNWPESAVQLSAADTVALRSIDFTCPLAELYARTQLPR